MWNTVVILLQSLSLSLSSYPCTQCGKDAKTTMNIDQLFKQSLELSTITLNMLVIVYSSYIHMHTHTHTHSLINLTSAQDSQVMWLYYRYVYIVIMPRGGATAYGSRVVCVSVCLSVCPLDFLQDGTESAA